MATVAATHLYDEWRAENRHASPIATGNSSAAFMKDRKTSRPQAASGTASAG